MHPVPLGVQQIDKRPKIERLLFQPCVGFGNLIIFSRNWQCYQSHTMYYEEVFLAMHAVQKNPAYRSGSYLPALGPAL